MNAPLPTAITQAITSAERYARALNASRRVRFDIDRDVIQGREFDFSRKFLPDGLSRVRDLPFLRDEEKIFFSQVQGRTYANIFGLVERFIAAKMLEMSRQHGLGDQTALEALVGFTGEEIKHQEMFRRLDDMAARGMPAGYVFTAEPNAVASAVLAASDWAVLGLTCHIELFVLSHYHSSIEPDALLSALWKDVFLHHAREEAQHAVLDELEWQREDARLDDTQRDEAVDQLIALVGAVDGILQQQARADATYFLANIDRTLSPAGQQRVADTLLRAYRWQYIVSGVQNTRFTQVLAGLVSAQQMQRVVDALQPILQDVATEPAAH